MRKEQITDAAIDVFLKKGYEGTTTKEIARVAGISEGTIFRYFKSKKDILLYTVDILSKNAISDFLKELGPQSPKQKAKDLLKSYYYFTMENQELIKFIITESQYYDDLKDKFNKDIVSKLIKTTEKALKSVLPPNTNYHLAAEALLGVFLGISMVKATVKEDDIENEKLLMETLNMLFHGIKNP